MLAEFIGGEMDGERMWIPDDSDRYRFAKFPPLNLMAYSITSFDPNLMPEVKTIEYIFWKYKQDRALFVLDKLMNGSQYK